MIPKYKAELVLDFQSVDRFIYRVADLNLLGHLSSKELLERLDNCHIYILGKRPRLSIAANSIQTTKDTVHFQVEYRLEGARHQTTTEIPRDIFRPEEVIFESSPYPHREIITRDVNGKVVEHTLLANFVHLMPNVNQKTKDLEVLYVGKGLRRSTQDRLSNHSTLQRILSDIHSNEPDMEVFALVYAFKYKKTLLAFSGIPAEITGHAARRHGKKMLAYNPALDDQVTLIEASIIAYFQPTRYNKQYLDFPNRKHLILKNVYDADFAAILVQLDNTNIGGQRIYSDKQPPKSNHNIVVDFRKIEGRSSLFDRLQIDN